MISIVLFLILYGGILLSQNMVTNPMARTEIAPGIEADLVGNPVVFE